MRKWQIKEAETRLSELVDRAQDEPQELLFDGKSVAVVLSREDYDRLAGALAGAGQSLPDFIRNSPLHGDEHLCLERQQTPSRKSDL